LGGQIRAERKRKTPQFILCWVLGCLPRWQDAIGAWRDPGESGLSLVDESHFHLRRIAGRDAGVRRPWWGEEFTYDERLMQSRRRWRMREVRREMAVVT
jgi:hypothetical protein